MGRKAIIHAGMPKTGSSAIQAALRDLRCPTHEYLQLGRPNHSRLLNAAVGDHLRQPMMADGLGANDLVEGRDDARRVLHDALVAAQAPSIVISAEVLKNFSVGALRTFRDFMRDHVDGETVFAYVRGPLSKNESLLQQSLKTGFYKGLGRLDLPHEFLDRLTAVFGGKNVRLLPFRRDLLLEGDVVRDFCAATGIPFAEVEPNTANESLSLEACAILFVHGRHRAFQLGSPGSSYAYSRLVRFLRNFGRDKLRLHPAVLSEHSALIRDSFDRVTPMLGVDLYDLDAEVPDDAIRHEDDLERIARRVAPDFRAFVDDVREVRGVSPRAISAAKEALGASDDPIEGVVRPIDALLFEAREEWRSRDEPAEDDRHASRGRSTDDSRPSGSPATSISGRLTRALRRRDR